MQIEIECSDVLRRIAELYEVGTDIELAKKLGVAAQTVSTWRNRNKIPYDKVIEIAAEKGVSLDFLIFGQANTALSQEGSLNQLASWGGTVEMTDLFHLIFNELDEELFLRERFSNPGEEPFWFLVNVYQKVTRHLPKDAKANSEEAHKLVHHFAKEEIEHYNRVLDLARKNTERREKKEAKTSSGSDKSTRQTFHGSVGQVGGGDIHNDFGKDK